MKPHDSSFLQLQDKMRHLATIAESTSELLGTRSSEQTLWMGIIIGVCVGFLLAVASEWLVDHFMHKDRGLQKFQPPVPDQLQYLPPPPPPQEHPRYVQAGHFDARPPASQAGDLHSWLMQCSDGEVHQFLSNFARGPRGHILAEVAGTQAPMQFLVRGDGPRTPTSQASLDASLFHSPHRSHSQALKSTHSSLGSNQQWTSSLPHVQFTELMHFVTEGEDVARLEIIRSEPLDRYTEVGFETKDSSAFAGTSYHATRGRIVFQPGERLQIIEVPIINNKYWDANLQFKVQLSGAGMVNAQLSKDMWQARVQVIDTGTFPTNEYKTELQAGRVHSIPQFRLLYEYFMYNMLNPKVMNGTIKMILVKQCHIFNFFLRLCLMVYLVDCVLVRALSPEGSYKREDLPGKLVGVAFAWLIPVGILHLLDYQSFTLGVAGQSKLVLQKAIMAKFLHFGHESRAKLRSGAVATAMSHDAEEVVDKGYMSLVKMTEVAGTVVALISFQLLVPLVFGRYFNPGVFIDVMLLPLLEIALLWSRKEHTMRQLLEKKERFEAVSRATHELTVQLPLIASYNHIPLATDRFTELVVQKNKCDARTAQLILNNNYIDNWVLAVFLAVYIIIGGGQVVRGQLQLGLFLANINIFQAISAACDKLAHLLMDMQQATPALARLCYLLNMPDDLLRKRQLAARTDAELQQFLDSGRHITIDDLPIRVGDIQFRYHGHSERALWEPINLRGVMQISQGSLVSLVGKRREGKTTLLKLLGGELLLQDESIIGPRSQVFIPPHLRVIHMHGEPIFFEGSLYENLVYGVSSDRQQNAFGLPEQVDNDGSLDRVLQICQMVGLSEDILRYVQSDESHMWSKLLSATDMFLLSLARAFIANPQVLCLHKPTLLFDEMSSQRILELLRRFVMERGLVQEHSLRDRRPRTCIFTSAKIAGVEISDQVFHVSRAHGIQVLEKDKVTADMLA